MVTAVRPRNQLQSKKSTVVSCVMHTFCWPFTSTLTSFLCQFCCLTSDNLISSQKDDSYSCQRKDSLQCKETAMSPSAGFVGRTGLHFMVVAYPGVASIKNSKCKEKKKFISWNIKNLVIVPFSVEYWAKSICKYLHFSFIQVLLSIAFFEIISCYKLITIKNRKFMFTQRL